MTRNLRKQLKKIKLKSLEIEMSKCDYGFEYFDLREKYWNLLDEK